MQDRKMQDWKLTDKNYKGWKMIDGCTFAISSPAFSSPALLFVIFLSCKFSVPLCLHMYVPQSVISAVNGSQHNALRYH